MADNTTLNTGSGGDTIASDDISGVKYPRSKIVIGADGTNDGDVSAANPLPVSLASVPSHAVTNAGTFAVQDGPSTSGGLTIFRSIDIDESEEEVKATAGQLYSIHCMNIATSIRYLKFYNATAANVTVGTTTPVLTLPIPAQSSGGAGFVWNIDKGLVFGTAISVAATTGVADNDTGAPGANEVVINLGYK